MRIKPLCEIFQDSLIDDQTAFGLIETQLIDSDLTDSDPDQPRRLPEIEPGEPEPDGTPQPEPEIFPHRTQPEISPNISPFPEISPDSSPEVYPPHVPGEGPSFI